MKQHFVQLIQLLLLVVLPITNDFAKMPICSAVSYILIECFTYLLSKYNVFSQKDDGFRYVKVTSNYTKLFTNYILNKYPNNIKISSYSSFNDLNIVNASNLMDVFEHNSNKYLMMIQIVTDDKGIYDDKNNKENIFGSYKPMDEKDHMCCIVIKSTAPIDVIKIYIDHVTIKSTRECKNNSDCCDIIIISIRKQSDGSLQTTYNRKSYLTNKTLDNLILSNNVHDLLFDNVLKFICCKEKYQSLGLPHKQNYLLYGEPGTGKTSIVKCIAKEYSFSIIPIDLTVISENAILIKMIQEIDRLVNGRHILLFEDIDRCPLFSDNDEEKKKCGITEDCLLNVLDGIDEPNNRLIFFTCNDKSKIMKNNALTRPGRIDIMVYITYCDNDQIKRIFKLHFGDDDIKLVDGITITPAFLIQIILHFKNKDMVLDVLNKIRNFTDNNLDMIVDSYKDKMD